MYMSYGRYDICMVFRVARHVEPCVCHNDHKTYTWNNIILYKRSMIRVFSLCLDGQQSIVVCCHSDTVHCSTSQAS